MASSLFAAELGPPPGVPPMDRTVTIAAVLAVATALVVVALDFSTPLELDVASTYALPLLLGAYTRRRPLVWSLALLLGVAALVIYHLHAGTVVLPLKDELFFNRVFDVVSLAITAGLLHLFMRSLEVRESQSHLLAEQNRRLETANRMLIEHDSQILQQHDELDRRHKQAVASSERTNRLLVAVSHDIRTPIQTIGLVAELMRRAGENPALEGRVPVIARQLQANAATLVSMVTDLLDLARFDSGHTDLHESNFALDELVLAKCRELEALAETKSLSLVAPVSCATLWVRSDRAKVNRVLANLIGNAIKFTSHGSVTVSVNLDASGAPVLQVTDTGRGIDPDAIKLIFEEYAQAGSTEEHTGQTEHPEHGWGLGLAISRRLAQALGANIDVASEFGHGSTFTLTLPASCVLDITPLDLPPSALGC